MRHEHIETNSGLMLLLILAVISVGGLVEIVPLFYINETIEKVDGVRPYTPLELRGRDIYIREGCYTVPLPADSPVPRRMAALWPLFAGG
jgi:cytochrome c oxidase cbb3-type subunit 2